LASAISPMYISEISPSSIRGTLVSWNQFAIIFGLWVVYFVNYGITFGETCHWIDAIGWRYMFMTEAIPAALFFILLFMLPETRRDLTSINKIEESSDVLKDICDAKLQEQHLCSE